MLRLMDLWYFWEIWVWFQVDARKHSLQVTVLCSYIYEFLFILVFGSDRIRNHTKQVLTEPLTAPFIAFRSIANEGLNNANRHYICKFISTKRPEISTGVRPRQFAWLMHARGSYLSTTNQNSHIGYDAAAYECKNAHGKQSKGKLSREARSH